MPASWITFRKRRASKAINNSNSLPSTSDTTRREGTLIHALCENKKGQVTRDSLRAIKSAAYEIGCACRYLVIGLVEVNMFLNLTEVR
jgi:hypothetical protein